jgi:hypothetical protein
VPGGEEYEHQPERSGGDQQRVARPFGGGHRPVCGDPRGIWLTDLGQRGRARLICRGQQLSRLRPLALWQGPDGALQVRDQAAQQVGQLGVASGVG